MFLLFHFLSLSLSIYFCLSLSFFPFYFTFYYLPSNFDDIVEPKHTSRYGPFGPFVKCINNLESKYLGEKLARHGSLESLERPKCEGIMVAPKPRKKEVELSDHIQFLITEKSAPQTSSSVEVSREAIDEGDVLSEGKFLNHKLNICSFVANFSVLVCVFCVRKIL